MSATLCVSKNSSVTLESVKTLRCCPIEKVQIGDAIIRNGKHYEIDYIEKDVHGFDVYAMDSDHHRTYFFIGDNETVTLDP